MQKFLFFGSVIAFAFGVLVFMGAQSAIHEMVALAFWLIGTLAFCTWAILEKLNAILGKLEEDSTIRMIESAQNRNPRE